jgi:uncharacterized protein (UPF0332 family)
MPQLDNHLKWCLSDPSRLIKVKPDKPLAEKHLKKSQYNFEVLQLLERNSKTDWALNAGFYSIYHCFLSMLALHGYSSRNQSCTVSAILSLIEENKLKLDKDLVLRFDTLDTESTLLSHTIRSARETSTYGVETSIPLNELKAVKELAITLQNETIRLLR